MLRTFLPGLAILLLALAPVGAEDAPKQSKPIAELIQQLNADEFADREAASKELTARGKEAVGALIEAAQGTSPEASSRALDILRKHHEGEQPELKAAAKEALQKLAAGDGAAARSAGEILAPKPMPVTPNAVGPRIAVRPGIRLGGGAVRIAIAGGAGAKRVSIKNVDGVKEIEVVEDARTTKINEDPAKGIKVKVTEKKDDKEESKEFEVKNAEELKEKHPEIHKIYEQYAKGFAGGDVIIGGGAAIRRIEPPAIIREPSAVLERLNNAEKQLTDAAEKLKELAKDEKHADQVRAMLEAIDAAKKELGEVKTQFPMR